MGMMFCTSSLAEQRHVAPDSQASSDALPAILSVKSVLSVVKNRIKFLTTDSTENTDESQTGLLSEEERSMFSHFALCGTDIPNR
jgi:hypothetical protein